MKLLTLTEFNAMIEGAELLKSDGFGPKVYRRSDAIYVKLFRQKRFFSLSNIWPYVKRFRSNSLKLKKRSIDTVTVVDIYNCPDIERTIITYKELEGQLLRGVLAKENSVAYVQQLAQFISTLHKKGIYFRSIHLENIVLQPNKELGLIDIADMRIRWFAISALKRVRNFRHMLKYTEDRKLLSINNRLDTFLNYYLASAQLGLINKYLFIFFVRKYIEPDFTPTI